MPKPILGNGDFTLPKSIVLPGLPIPSMSPLEVWIVPYSLECRETRKTQDPNLCSFAEP